MKKVHTKLVTVRTLQVCKFSRNNVGTLELMIMKLLTVWAQVLLKDISIYILLYITDKMDCSYHESHQLKQISLHIFSKYIPHSCDILNAQPQTLAINIYIETTKRKL